MRELVATTRAGRDGEEIVPYEGVSANNTYSPESSLEAESEGPDATWSFWDGLIKSALIHERRFRQEAAESEMLFFGPDNDPGISATDDTQALNHNRISDKEALIHSNVEVLKPLLYSDTPQPVVRRRFRGDGKTDETDIMAAEAGQRIAQFLIETEDFDGAMEAIRDDWLIAGRGAGRVIYKADIAAVDMPMPDGSVQQVEVKTSERVFVRYVEWRRIVFAPSHSWEQLPWLAIETPMTRRKVQERFGPEKAESFSFNSKGLFGASAGISDEDRDQDNKIAPDSTTGDPAISPFDTAMVWEIWDREREKVVWWSPECRSAIVDEQDDILGLEHFYPMPKPLLATVKGQQLTPRPDIKYYERRAREIDLATEKLKTILDAISVSGLFPGSMAPEIQKLLDGKNTMIPVESWLSLMEKGGTSNIIQWLPLQAMIAAIQALITLREQAKQAMFEASGVSDIMRAQGDPNETATAQQIKGRFAGMRLSDKQRKIALYARDLIRLMLEVAVEHFDTRYLADITGLDLPLTELDRQAMIEERELAKAQFEELTQSYQMLAQAIEAGQAPGPMPPAPEAPEFDRIPETSWELVHERLRTDYMRKISVTIETQSTILADEQADKEARIEFLKAFSMFVSELAPLAGTGQFDYKTVKELLMFGIRGFPKSRTLESMIAALPDEPKGEPPEDTAVTVANIRAQVDVEIEKMRMADKEAERQHETKLKGVDLMAEAERMAAEPNPAPSGP